VSTRESPPRQANQLLAALPDDDYQSLRSFLEEVPLALKQVLFEKQALIEYVYFPIDCIISLVIKMGNGEMVEVGTVGDEGVSGVPLVLEASRSPFTAFAQVPGRALRMRARDLLAALEQSGPFANLMLRYAEAFLSQVAQGGACNQLHSISQRCARWLLLTRDRLHTDEFPLTHEFLCQMLGVRRATVSEIASAFQKAGYIRYYRGWMTIVDRRGLEATTCECYRVIRGEYQRLLQTDWGSK
jgi:CRP-like cAMP-binding protein